MGARAVLLELYNSNMNQSGMSPNVVGLGIGQVAAAGATSTSSSAVTLAVGNSWIVAGMNVYDVTSGQQVGTVGSYTAGSTSLTLGANASHAITSGDVLQFGFTPSDIQVGYADGSDIRGIVELCQLKCSEAIALLTYLQNDVITSAQDNAAYTLLGTAITDLT